MKKTLLTIALVAMAAVSSFAQGTVAFGNSALTRVTVTDPAGTKRNATAADAISVSVWFGPAGSAAEALAQAGAAATIGSTAGVLINAPSVFALPGTEPNQVVSLQIRATGNNGLLVGQTKVAQVTLGQTAGPGAVIWQTSDTNPSRFTPLNLTVVPEPSTIALGVLGLGSLLLFRRRK